MPKAAKDKPVAARREKKVRTVLGHVPTTRNNMILLFRVPHAKRNHYASFCNVPPALRAAGLTRD